MKTVLPARDSPVTPSRTVGVPPPATVPIEVGGDDPRLVGDGRDGRQGVLPPANMGGYPRVQRSGLRHRSASHRGSPRSRRAHAGDEESSVRRRSRPTSAVMDPDACETQRRLRTTSRGARAQLLSSASMNATSRILPGWSDIHSPSKSKIATAAFGKPEPELAAVAPGKVRGESQSRSRASPDCAR